jgi:GTP-binding protein HflX
MFQLLKHNSESDNLITIFCNSEKLVSKRFEKNMHFQNNTPILKALLVSVITPKTSAEEAEASLRELERLVTTLGFKVIAQESQRQPSTSGMTVVGQGKLMELARWTGGPGSTEPNKVSPKKSSQGTKKQDENDLSDTLETPNELATIAVFDCDLTPSQLRTLALALGVQVFDRTGIIIEIFSRHAKTRAARLQVDIARLKYLAPRLQAKNIHSEHQAGRGAGESGLELDRRQIRDRLAELKRELENVQNEHIHRRSQRAEQMCVALVGYTNAGKSSAMRADKLFATLDTTVRALYPATHPRILVSDTVGFINKLPHDLIASFRSTLDEALSASLLLYLVDASDPHFRSQLATVREVLQEIGAIDTKNILVLNKVDLLSSEQKKELKQEFPRALLISTRKKEDIQILRERMIKHFEKEMKEEEFFILHTEKKYEKEIRANTRIIKEIFEPEGVRFTVKARSTELGRLKKLIPKNSKSDRS